MEASVPQSIWPRVHRMEARIAASAGSRIGPSGSVAERDFPIRFSFCKISIGSGFVASVRSICCRFIAGDPRALDKLSFATARARSLPKSAELKEGGVEDWRRHSDPVHMVNNTRMGAIEPDWVGPSLN